MPNTENAEVTVKKPTGSVRALLPITFARQIREICRTERQRVEVDAVIKALDIDTTGATDPLSFVPLGRATDLLERAGVIFSDPWFGLTMARGFRTGGSGLLGQIVLNAPTAREAMHQLAACAPTLLFPLTGGFVEDRARKLGRLRWSFKESAPGLTQSFQFSQMIMGVVVLRLRSAIGTDWAPHAVSFEYEPVPVSTEARQLLGPVITFRESESSLSIALDTLDRPMEGADPVLYAVMGDLAKRWLKEARVEPVLISETRDAIRVRLKSGAVGLDTIAKALGMTPRLLQSRLEQFDTNFEAVLGETRSEIALELLRETDLPLSDIAYDLGYSDPSVLTRAVRRWFDKSPSEIRRQGKLSG